MKSAISSSSIRGKRNSSSLIASVRHFSERDRSSRLDSTEDRRQELSVWPLAAIPKEALDEIECGTKSPAQGFGRHAYEMVF